jgi:hypothetical protein
VKNTWVSGHLTVPIFLPLMSLTVVFFSEICKEFGAIAVTKQSLPSLYFRCVSLLLYLVFRTKPKFLEQERGNPRYALIVDTRAVLLESACVFHLFQNAR